MIQALSRTLTLSTLLGISFAEVGAQSNPGVAEVGREQRVVGQELRILEGNVTQPKDPGGSDGAAREAMATEPSAAIPLDESETKENGQRILVDELVVKGDSEWLASEGAEEKLRTSLLDKELTMQTVREKVQEIQNGLVEEGFYLASLEVEGFDPGTGTLTVAVDAGRVGQMSFRFLDTKNPQEFSQEEDGRFFSKKQLSKRMRNVDPGDIFNYFDFYDVVYGINVHPDLVMDTDFVVNSQIDDGILRRDIDMNFTVEEERPLHAAVSVNNYGTDTTEDWQLVFTVQHLNLTKNDDVLTISAPVSIDFQSLISGAASYSIPYYAGNGGQMTVYGGYSTLDAREVVDGIDVKGDGWFTGFQWSHNLVYNRDHLLTGSLGLVRRYVEDQLVVGGFETQPRDATVMPYSAALSYTQLKPDFLGGRNMATIQALYNQGDFLGTSDTEQVRTLRPQADADYLIGRFQLARIQPLFGKVEEDGTKAGQWVFFSRLEGQIANGPLIPAEQIGIGGHRSVRGYEEFEFYGDDGGFVNLEMRTPMLLGLLSRTFGIKPPEDSQYAADRLQGVFFVDVGYTRIQDPLPSEDADETIAGAGLGFRLSLSEYAQFRFDWGFPLVETAASNSGGVGYVELQLQF